MDICTSRLTQERKLWRKDHPYGFYARPAKAANGDLNLRVWQVGIPGKAGSLWEGGVYKVKMKKAGRQRLTIGWKPAITIKQIVLGIQDLLAEPNLSDPAQAPATRTYNENRPEYERQVKRYVLMNRPAE
ncbi:E2 SUMO-conjugating protein ubc9 [Kappamyces sp. JEL0829]|nr:E2 SUMO-conjugating protein ubc9 [Kappamyces sp. JEL0829]